MKKAVIFDFDGTIADSLLGVLAVFERAHKRELGLEEVNDFRHKSFIMIARELKIPIHKLIWLALFGRRYFRQHVDKVKLNDGMDELLKELHDKGINLYIVSTNKAETIHEFLKTHGLGDIVRSVYGKAWFWNKAPRMRTLLKQEGLSSSEACYVGDEIIDIVSARRVGLPIMSVTWGYTTRELLEKLHPDELVDTTDELRRVLLQ